jgi:FAD/FMN-containing dehydrogenase
MLLESWGRHPIIDAEQFLPGENAGVRAALDRAPSLIPFGQGRSYGDSALAARVLRSGRLDRLLAFDPGSGVLDCQAGVTLDAILRVFVPKGWFLPVTPGTKYISVGGAIASDVHGKSHHVNGCFSETVLDFDLMLADGSLRRCSREENADLFRATCGGMGLTGIVLRARLRLLAIRSSVIEQETHKARDLEELLDRFEETRSSTYAVAWIDCMSRGAALGRSVLTVGDFSAEGGLTVHREPRIGVPLVPPVSPVTPVTMRAFSAFLYHKVLRRRSRQRVHYEQFFYPLDGVLNWNRMYGPSGFTQYQFVLPRAAGPKGLRSLLEAVAESGKGTFLAVLKVMGAANDNPLSFPLEGYTLAVDFKLQAGLFPLLDGLDARVADLGGRVYLSKDVRLGEAAFKRFYPRWTEFQALRERTGAKGRFASLQSRRLGLD